MIDLVNVAVAGPDSLSLTFTDGAHGVWSGTGVVARSTELTAPLADPTYFAKAFIEGGAGLAWPNGLALSAAALWRELSDAGSLILRAA
jgi:Protein of unknown function (DUF2442)